MGYDTRFTGEVVLDREIDAATASAIHAYRLTRHEDIGNKYGGYWSHYVVNESRNGLEIEDADSVRSAHLHLARIIDRILRPAGYILNGRLEAQGEDPDDRWAILVEDNVVIVIDYEIHVTEISREMIEAP